jgi:hypothetical protein
MLKSLRIFGALAAWAFLATPPASAQTLSGVIPPGKTVTLFVQRPLIPRALRFTFSAPPVNAHVRYALSYCIGPRSNPCGLPPDIVIVVPMGVTKSATYASTLFLKNAFVVGQGTRVPTPYRVVIQ